MCSNKTHNRHSCWLWESHPKGFLIRVTTTMSFWRLKAFSAVYSHMSIKWMKNCVFPGYFRQLRALAGYLCLTHSRNEHEGKGRGRVLTNTHARDLSREESRGWEGEGKICMCTGEVHRNNRKFRWFLGQSCINTPYRGEKLSSE